MNNDRINELKKVLTREAPTKSKSFHWKSKTLLLIVAAALLTAGGVFALTTWWSSGFDLTIVESTSDLEAFGVYVDQEGTQPYIQPIHFGHIEQGSSFTIDFYIKNEGDLEGTVAMRILEDISSFMVYSFSPASLTLIPNEVGLITMSVTILSDATPGISSGTIELYTP